MGGEIRAGISGTVQVTIGPWIDNGFYYDFDLETSLTDKDLKLIQKEMQKIIKRNLPITREEVTREEAVRSQKKRRSLRSVFLYVWRSF